MLQFGAKCPRRAWHVKINFVLFCVFIFLRSQMRYLSSLSRIFADVRNNCKSCIICTYAQRLLS